MRKRIAIVSRFANAILSFKMAESLENQNDLNV
jgi:hypothetical protein